MVKTRADFVRKHWKVATAFPNWGGCNTVWGIYLGPETDALFGFGTSKEAWAAAAEFTEQRLEEIRQVEEEIAILRSWQESVLICSDATGMVYDRIIAREQSALDDLKEGMRP